MSKRGLIQRDSPCLIIRISEAIIHDSRGLNVREALSLIRHAMKEAVCPIVTFPALDAPLCLGVGPSRSILVSGLLRSGEAAQAPTWIEELKHLTNLRMESTH